MKKPLVIEAVHRGELKDAAIARRFGCTPGYVCVLRRQCGLPAAFKRRAWTAAEIGTLRRRRADGVGFRQIGDELGRTADAVRVACQQFGVSVPRT